jgi:hypothetical protein
MQNDGPCFIIDARKTPWEITGGFHIDATKTPWEITPIPQTKAVVEVPPASGEKTAEERRALLRD